MTQDIFDSIDRLLESGPTDDEVRAATEAAQEQQNVASATSAPAVAGTVSDAPSASATTTAATTAPAAAGTSVLVDDDLQKYEGDIHEIGITNPQFTNIIPTTFGLSGLLSNVSFNESALMPFIAPHLHFPCIRAVCNFGDIMTSDFQQLVADGRIDLTSVEKSTRARTKKQNRVCAKQRKIQGNGTCFNSSILFWIYSETHHVVYKIRLFRTGQFGLPGTKPEMIRDILRICRDIFIPTLYAILSARDQASQAHLSRSQIARSSITLISIAPIMKNYKWRRIIPKSALLNLSAISARIKEDATILGRLPYPVNYIQYTMCDAKLSVKFNTPAIDRTDKTVRVNLFLSGKINILGAHDSVTTKKICEYLASILTDSVVVGATNTDEDDEFDMEASDPEMIYSDDD